MRKIAILFTSTALFAVSACSQADNQAPTKNPADVAEAVKKAQADAQTARATQVIELEKKLASAKTGKDYADVVVASGAHPKIKAAAQKKLADIVRPVIDGVGKNWAPLDELMLWLPGSNPLWNEAWTKKEQLKATASKK